MGPRTWPFLHISMRLQRMLMKLRRFTKFGMIHRAVRLTFCLNEKSEKGDMVEVARIRIALLPKDGIDHNKFHWLFTRPPKQCYKNFSPRALYSSFV